MKRFAFPILTLWLAAGLTAADTYTADASHSHVGFAVSHMVIAKVKGSFTEFSGTLIYDAKDLTRSSIRGRIAAASINTGNAQRDDHLRSADFFDAEKFPDILFESVKVVKRGTGHAVLGRLTIRGVTKEVEIPFTITGTVKDPWGGERLGVEASPLTIDRRDFGLTWNKALEAGGVVVGPTVTLELAGEFVKEKPKEPEAK
jgi:polyisoprenoid-binding protein YceI